MTRRTLLKLIGLIPFLGPAMAQALTRVELKPARAFVPYLPKNFPKWNRAIDGLESAASWVSESERSLSPRSIVFPNEGQIWEALQDSQVSFCAHFAPPDPDSRASSAAAALPLSWAAFPFGHAVLRRGERVRIISGDGTPPLSVTFRPLRYRQLQNSIVPEKLRSLPGYEDYTLSARTAKTIAGLHLEKGIRLTWFVEDFKLIEDAV